MCSSSCRSIDIYSLTRLLLCIFHSLSNCFTVTLWPEFSCVWSLPWRFSWLDWRQGFRLWKLNDVPLGHWPSNLRRRLRRLLTLRVSFLFPNKRWSYLLVFSIRWFCLRNGLGLGRCFLRLCFLLLLRWNFCCLPNYWGSHFGLCNWVFLDVVSLLFALVWSQNVSSPWSYHHILPSNHWLPILLRRGWFFYLFNLLRLWMFALIYFFPRSKTFFGHVGLFCFSRCCLRLLFSFFWDRFLFLCNGNNFVWS